MGMTVDAGIRRFRPASKEGGDDFAASHHPDVFAGDGRAGAGRTVCGLVDGIPKAGSEALARVAEKT